MRFRGKVAIVTGGTRGIGRAIVIRLASEGATVALCARQSGEHVDSVVAEAKAAGGDAFFSQADVSDVNQVANFVRAVTEKYGKVDILVNNVAQGHYSLLIDIDQATLDKTIDTTLKAPLYVTQAVVRGMMERRSGKIINISSDAGRIGSSRTTVYSACKGGIIAFTKSLALEVARYNINVNCVAPGNTNTEAFREAIPAGRLEAIAKSIPLNRIAEPDEVAGAVAFLASDEAGYITGQTLSVSGGVSRC